MTQIISKQMMTWGDRKLTYLFSFARICRSQLRDAQNIMFCLKIRYVYKIVVAAVMAGTALATGSRERLGKYKNQNNKNPFNQRIVCLQESSSDTDCCFHFLQLLFLKIQVNHTHATLHLYKTLSVRTSAFITPTFRLNGHTAPPSERLLYYHNFKLWFR